MQDLIKVTEILKKAANLKVGIEQIKDCQKEDFFTNDEFVRQLIIAIESQLVTLSNFAQHGYTFAEFTQRWQ